MLSIYLVSWGLLEMHLGRLGRKQSYRGDLSVQSVKGSEGQRKRILQAAIGLFETQGVSNTTMEQVAQSAQINRRTIYRYFPSKEDILRASIEDYSLSIIEKMRREVDQALPFLTYLTECMLYTIDRVPQEKFYQLQSVGEVERSSRNTYFSSAVLHEHWLQCFRDKYIDALRRREINPKLELATILNWAGRVSFSFIEHPGPAQAQDELREEIDLYFINTLRYGA